MTPIEQKLKAVAPAVFPGTPVLFAYLYGSYAKTVPHLYSDLDIGIYIRDLDIEACLNLELSLAVRLDEKLNHRIQTEVRILNHLPLSVKGRILGEARLIYSIDDEQRVAFETFVRRTYFDFLPVILHHRQAYIKKIVSESQNGIS